MDDELKFYIKYDSRSTQPAITRSKLTIETEEQGVKYVKVNNKDTRMTPMTSLCCLYR